ncbi:MAG: histidinol-phosphate transaminase [Endomicrobia bacterium]|nr:histidinol-phosphate transaminase [Endomicrobiia bacterium]
MREKEQILPIPRKEIESFHPYIPGRPIEEVRRKYNIKNIYKLASNENPLGCTEKVTRFLRKFPRVLHRYPESTSLVLRQKIAEYLKIKPDEVIIGAGSDEIIEIIAKTYFNKKDNIVVSKHAFIRYKMAAELMGCKVKEVPMKNYTHNLEEMAKNIDSNTKAVFIANPNNPTGTYNKAIEFDNFLRNVLSKNLYPLIITDEAYYEYAKLYDDYPETLSFRKLYKNLIILRTFSKIYGLAGLRVGYGIADEKIIADMDRVRPPFNVSVVAQLLATLALEDQQHIRKSQDLIKKEKQFMYNELEKIDIKYIPSAANFVLINVYPFRGKKIFEKLLRNGIIVRAMDEYELPYHIRVTIGMHNENVSFLNSLKYIFKKG